MVNRVQTFRSSVAGARPSGRPPGELYTNFADNQFGVISPSAVAVDLVAVRFFTTTANYAIGDYVIQAGNLYRAIAASAPGAFVLANWSKVQSAADIATGYLPLAGGTLTGALLLNADPSVALHPVTLQYLQAQLTAYLLKTGGTLTGALGINPAAGGASINISPGAAAQQGLINFFQGAAKWQLGKQNDDSFLLYDVAAAAFIISIPSNGTTVIFGRSVVLNADPSTALGAATKQYADTKVAKAGDTMTGNLTLNPPSAGANIIMNPAAAAQQALIQFQQSGLSKWLFGKRSNNDFYLNDPAGSDVFNVPSGGATVTFGKSVLLSADPTVALGAATKQYVDNAVLLPGVILAYAGNVAPVGYFLCNGQNVSRASNPVLSAMLAGLTPAYPFGVGDGSTTMGIPDLRGRAPLGIHDMAGSPTPPRLGVGITGGLTALTLGSAGGEYSHSQTVTETASHGFPSSARSVLNAGQNFSPAGSAAAGGVSIGTDGSQLPGNQLPPILLVGYIVKGG